MSPLHFPLGIFVKQLRPNITACVVKRRLYSYTLYGTLISVGDYPKPFKFDFKHNTSESAKLWGSSDTIYKEYKESKDFK